MHRIIMFLYSPLARINDVGTLFMIKKILVENFSYITYSAVTQLGKCFMLIVCDVLFIDVQCCLGGFPGQSVLIYPSHPNLKLG